MCTCAIQNVQPSNLTFELRHWRELLVHCMERAHVRWNELTGVTRDLRGHRTKHPPGLRHWTGCNAYVFEIRVFCPNAQSNHASQPSTDYTRQESEKRYGYGQRVRDIEHGPFGFLINRRNGNRRPNCIQKDCVTPLS